MTETETNRPAGTLRQVWVRGTAAELADLTAQVGSRPLAHGVRAFVAPADAENWQAAAEAGTLLVLSSGGWTILPPTTTTAETAEGELCLYYDRGGEPAPSESARRVALAEAAQAAIDGGKTAGSGVVRG